jgi:hypothetical protein
MQRAPRGSRPRPSWRITTIPHICTNMPAPGRDPVVGDCTAKGFELGPRRCFPSTRCPRRQGTSPQPRRGYPRGAPELPTGTRCSGAVAQGTTRSSVLGLTARRSKRNVSGSLATPRRIAREAADREVGPPRKTIIGTGSSDLNGSLSQLPDRGPASPNTGSRFCSVRSRSAVATALSGRTFGPGAVQPAPARTRPSAYPSHEPDPDLSVHRLAARPGRGWTPSTPAAPSIRRWADWRRGATSGPCRPGIDRNGG